jgi:hypothetical protein
MRLEDPTGALEIRRRIDSARLERVAIAHTVWGELFNRPVCDLV